MARAVWRDCVSLAGSRPAGDCRNLAGDEEGSAAIFSVTTFLVWARSLALGWVTLLIIAYAVEGPVLRWSAPMFGAIWIATAHLAFDCMTLAAAGFVAGRFNRSRAVLMGVLFAATLCFWNFGDALALNVPWLLRLAGNSFHDSRYLDSLIASVETHALLFGCLFAGAMLSRAREKPASIVE